MISGMCDVVFEYTCSICEEKQQERHRIALSMVTPNPSPPKGWRMVDCYVICDKHRVELKVSTKIGAGEAVRWIDL